MACAHKSSYNTVIEAYYFDTHTQNVCLAELNVCAHYGIAVWCCLQVCERTRTEKRDGKSKMSTDWCAGNFITHMAQRPRSKYSSA
jgi:hypothetical protein